MTIIRGVVILMLNGWFIPTRPPDENCCQEPTVSINVVAGYSYVSLEGLQLIVTSLLFGRLA
jgi:hypothetical protein